MDEPTAEANSGASQRYQVDVNIQGAPAAFDELRAFADFQVSNESCVPEDPVSGARSMPLKRLELEIRSSAEGSYRSYVYLDSLKDADYFGSGICHWQLTSVGIAGTKGKTTLTAALTRQELISGQETVTRYANASLDGTHDLVDPGTQDAGPSQSMPSFTIRMRGKELKE